MARALVHPRLTAALADFYPSLCTIQQGAPTRDSLGQPIMAWSSLANHVDLPCRLFAGSGSEVEQPDRTYVRKAPIVALRGHYSSITESMRAVVGGVTYDIEQVRHDGQGATTYLDVEAVQ